MIFQQNRLAFTLAEVLITLAIIGIIAEMTIPTLLSDVNRQIEVVGFKKAYSTWNQAIKLMANDSGCSGDLSCFFDSDNAQIMGPKVEKYFKLAKSCPNGLKDCFPTDTKLNFDGTGDVHAIDSGNSYYFYEFVTADGMSFIFDYPNVNCNNSLNPDVNSNMSKECADIWVDVNGPKGPNYLGRDIFRFFITNGKGPNIYPYGGPEAFYWKDNSVGDCNKGFFGGTSTHGLSCAGRIIDEGWQMNY